MRSVTHVVIPTRERWDLLLPLVQKLVDQREYDRVYVFDNSPNQSGHYHLAPFDAVGVRVMPARESSIYRMWNDGWDLSLAWGTEVNLAILNDDIDIPQNFLSRLEAALRCDPRMWLVYPDYSLRVADDLLWDELPPRRSHGTYRVGGMCGWAFMVRAEMRRVFPELRIDEQYEWWCGDDDLAQRILELGGSQGKVVGLPVDHVNEATMQRHPELHDAKARDVERWKAAHGGVF